MNRLEVRLTRRQVACVDRAEAAREGLPVRAAELDAVAGAEVPLSADDSDGEQAAPRLDDCAPRPLVHMDAAAHPLPVAQPEFERRFAGRGRFEAGPARLAR